MIVFGCGYRSTEWAIVLYLALYLPSNACSLKSPLNSRLGAGLAAAFDFLAVPKKAQPDAAFLRRKAFLAHAEKEGLRPDLNLLPN